MNFKAAPLHLENRSVPLEPSSPLDAPTTPSHGDETGLEPTTEIQFGSLSQLKAKAPKIYHQMVLSMGMNICRYMQHQNERLKDLMRHASHS